MKLRPAAAVVLLVTAAVTTACADPAGPGQGPAAAGSPSSAPATASRYPAAFPNTPSTAGFRLPIDTYVPTPSQLAYLGFAHDVVIRTCLQKQGYSTPAAVVPSAATFADPEERRYGVLSDTVARQYGYHLPKSEVVEPTSTKAADYGNAPAAAVGNARPATPTSAGVAPTGGCAAQADQDVPSSSSQQTDLGLAYNISELSFQQSQKDPRVTAATAAWSSCMAGKGYDFPTPIDASNAADLTTAAADPQEIATAVADVACKQASGLTATWSGVEASLQNSEIAAHAKQLTAQKATLSQRLARAQAAIGVTAPTR